MVSQPEQYHDVLQRIMKAELAGVMRYTHYALMMSSVEPAQPAAVAHHDYTISTCWLTSVRPA